MEALALSHGFPILILWQPTLVRSGKRRTEWERSLMHDRLPLQRLTARCSEQVVALMRRRADSNFVDLESVFDRDTASVFLDHYGHVTEAANDKIAAVIADLVYARLQGAPGVASAAR
jgi:hypothetical protein